MSPTDPEFNALQMAPANQAPRCQHTKLSGAPCAAPALRGQRLCYFHEQMLRPRRDYTLPLVEDAASLQFALRQVLRALQEKAYDHKTCALMLYALQIASSNLKRMTDELPQPEPQESGLAGLLLAELARLQVSPPDTVPGPEVR